MHRRNGEVVRLRAAASTAAPVLEVRSVCRACGQQVPRGQDRPYCIQHAPYARALRRELAGR